MEAVAAVHCAPALAPKDAPPRAGEAARGARAAATAAAVLVSLLLASGCVREAAKEATSGTLEALGRGARDAAGAADGSAETPAGGARQRERPLVGAIVHDAVSAGAAELGRQAGTLEPVIAQTSEAVSSAVVQGALQHDRELLTLVEQGSGAAARAVAREGTAELVEQLAGCPAGDPGCSSAAIERASRAAATGFADGLGRAIQPWIIGLAFGGGFLLAALIAVAVAAVARRHDRSAAQ
ncbi:hypothetical protein [Sorangium cellulosum]|uniref:Uncharacterized protein n=1 Tax=Sorangium cellulosum TaxID=56 RepID=A0A150QIZ1_SORCE|nr:hypothetical protein [Sorangium cellulosum]KYF67941.1 hypothetical protein BE15_45035 [Sorangium cellulosum]